LDAHVLPPFLQLKFPANGCLEFSAPCIPHNLLFGDEKNSQEDVYFSFADYRTDVCVQIKSQTVKLFVEVSVQAASTGNCGFRW
jgi:hypothetical protein